MNCRVLLLDPPPRQVPEAMAKLKKAAKRTKEILSANTAAPMSVESLLPDVDFRSD